MNKIWQKQPLSQVWSLNSVQSGLYSAYIFYLFHVQHGLGGTFVATMTPSGFMRYCREDVEF